ncbi:multidrug effflux MFS transporter [Paenibacillus aurantius]|uniref:Bcr/CflA family efflux transporter n=1 Tax=Paenibacillus aurantius TaxID=2918900 RepID=A0AA96LGI0_9BACL|nr:multidrug effflux MFS transporter [Paenibacillus aurantius]WNQ12855.1 multidrug effflux MFS transporter [Paenibacillus aurantius]
MAILLGSLSAFGPLSLDLYLPALPALEQELHAGTSIIQLTLTACLLGLSVGQLFAGSISDVRGRKGPLITGLVVYAAASLLCALSPSVGLLIVLRFLQGFAGAAGIVISRAVVRDLYEGPELTKFFSLLMLVNGAAPILAPIAGGQLLKLIPWQGLFVVLSVISLLMLAGVLLGLPETLPAGLRSEAGLGNTLRTFGTLVKDRVFMGYALAQGLVTAAMFAYISGSPFVIQEIYGVSAQGFSLLFAMNGAGIILAGQVTGRLAAKVGEKRLLIAGLLLAALGGVSLLIVLAWKAPLPWILPPLFLVVSCVGIVSTAGFSLAMQNHGRTAGSASALLGLMSLLFGALVAPLVGLGGSGTALPMGLVIAAADIGSVLVYVFLIHRRMGSRS